MKAQRNSQKAPGGTPPAEVERTLWETIGHWVRVYRLEKGWSLEALGTYSGTTKTTVANIEAGIPGQGEKLSAVMRALGREWEDFTSRVFFDGYPAASLELLQGGGDGTRPPKTPLVSVVRD